MKKLLFIAIFLFSISFAGRGDSFYDCTMEAVNCYLSESLELEDSLPDTIYFMGGEQLNPMIRLRLNGLCFGDIKCKVIGSPPNVMLNSPIDTYFFKKATDACLAERNMFVYCIGYDLICDSLIVDIQKLIPNYLSDAKPPLDWSRRSERFVFVYNCVSHRWEMQPYN